MATKVAVVDVKYIVSESKLMASKLEAWHNNEEYTFLVNGLHNAESEQNDYRTKRSSWNMDRLNTLYNNVEYCRSLLSSRDEEELNLIRPEVEDSINSIIQQLVAEQGIDLLCISQDLI